MADLTVPLAIRVAATLRVADHLADGPRTAAELAERTGVRQGPLDTVLRRLAAAGVLSAERSGRYGLTPRGEALRDDHPSHARRRLDMEGALGRAELSFVELLETVRTGRNAYIARYGRSLWEDLAADAALSDSFDAMMAFNMGEVVGSVLAAYDWGSLKHVVDVGGGNGALLAALLGEHPHLRGGLVDLPQAAEAARHTFDAAGVADRADIFPQSFFDPLPSGADAYLLSDVLHDWADEEAKAVLRRCAEAAGGSGQVCVIGEFGADGESPSTAMDMRMLAFVDGKERRISQVGKLAEECGLGVSGVHSAGEISVVVLRPLTGG
ncbi:methyltransferase [Streptomyces daliensis]|uniref:Methyltransferase n=1 Tax=Streptomyces daliensis TaxID=299421 RepID=A0A8T4IU32_9ACTN|nr:methyltransferase [Streptomyces daliensis]